MKKYSIENGNFTENGNYSGYTAEGKRIHIPGRLMNSIGFSIDKPVPSGSQFFIVAEESEINPFIPGTKTPQTNSDGTLVVSLRTTAKSAYLTKEALFTASNTSKLLDAEADAHFNKSVKELGLTEADITAFANASI